MGPSSRFHARFTVEVLPRYLTMEPRNTTPTLTDLENSEEPSLLVSSRGTMEHVVTENSDGLGDDLPEGKMLPLTSKKLVLEQLRILASMLGVSTKPTAAKTCQLIETKLLELEFKPRSIQVLVGTDSRLYLVDETWVIQASPEVRGQ